MEDGGGGGDWFGDPGVHGESPAYDGMEGFVLPSPVLQHASPVLQLTPPSPSRPESEKWWTSESMTSQNDPMSHYLYNGSGFDPLAAEKARRAQEEEMHQRIAARKKRNLDPMLHCEGESDVEDIYDNATQCDDISTIPAVKRQVKRPGPTLRSHSQVEADVIPDWVPSDDEGDKGFLKEEEDDGYEPLPFVLAGGRKSRRKMAKERVWYDDSRQNPEQQFMVGLCFKDVYQFRQALARLHIVQVRNFHYHRNTPDRIIVWCKDKQKKNNEENVKEKEKKWDCPFYMTAAKIKNEATFCIKKMELKHTCPTDGFDEAMEEMKKHSEEAWKWLSKILVEAWARFAMDTNCQTDLVVNNLSEVFNKYILDVRNKPTVTMLVGIYDKCMVR
ncbi:hypothetical protein QYE76_021743 [Lolium multiflorum]|uniref:Transposase MuDR plant domain-containing protein n=1 Tax=Lolium multiflorum TaxID=4521 RepID=A0AAD8R8Y1_LOLMU|nr:hypothetical protein QYE76_021743 [Lolium multiflorum]